MKRDIDQLTLIKDLLNEWARYYRPDRNTGYPKQSAFATERVQTSNRSTETYIDNVPEEITRLNKEIETGLAPDLKQIVRQEYFEVGTRKMKAQRLKMTRQTFDAKLHAVLSQLHFRMFG